VRHGQVCRSAEGITPSTWSDFCHSLVATTVVLWVRKPTFTWKCYEMSYINTLSVSGIVTNSNGPKVKGSRRGKSRAFFFKEAWEATRGFMRVNFSFPFSEPSLCL
jgi:hypothetical protein